MWRTSTPTPPKSNLKNSSDNTDKLNQSNFSRRKENQFMHLSALSNQKMLPRPRLTFIRNPSMESSSTSTTTRSKKSERLNTRKSMINLTSRTTRKLMPTCQTFLPSQKWLRSSHNFWTSFSPSSCSSIDQASTDRDRTIRDPDRCRTDFRGLSLIWWTSNSPLWDKDSPPLKECHKCNNHLSLNSKWWEDQECRCHLWANKFPQWDTPWWAQSHPNLLNTSNTCRNPSQSLLEWTPTTLTTNNRLVRLFMSGLRESLEKTKPPRSQVCCLTCPLKKSLATWKTTSSWKRKSEKLPLSYKVKASEQFRA